MRPGALVLLVVMLLLAGCTQTTAVAPVTSPVPATGPALGKGEWAAAACGSYHTLADQAGRHPLDLGPERLRPARPGHDRHPRPRHPDPGRPTPATGRPSPAATATASPSRRTAPSGPGATTGIGGADLGLGENDWERQMDAPTRVAHAHDWAAVFYGYFHGLALEEGQRPVGVGGQLLRSSRRGQQHLGMVPGRGRPRRGLGGRRGRRRLLAGRSRRTARCGRGASTSTATSASATPPTGRARPRSAAPTTGRPSRPVSATAWL